MKNTVVSAVIGLFGGGVVGFCVSFLVNLALLEISVNGFFAVLFGFALLFMGFLILYRVNALSWQSQERDMHGGSGARRPMSSYFVMIFACFVILAGFCCFFLERDWFKFISPGMKIPMYTLLGIALWFALTFSVMDLLNFSGQYCVNKLSNGRRAWKPIISSPSQICVVLVVAVSLGIFFGIVFGVLDVEDNETGGLQHDHRVTIPIGTIICACVGAVNEAYFKPRLNNDEYRPAGKAADYDDGI